MTINEVYQNFFDLEDVCEIETIIGNRDYFIVIFSDNETLTIPAGTEISQGWAESKI